LFSTELKKLNFNFKQNVIMKEDLNIPQDSELNKTDVIGSAKVTFGLTKNNLEVIKKYTSRWEGAEFDRDTWIRVGEEIGWESLTACLWYFRKHYR